MLAQIICYPIESVVCVIHLRSAFCDLGHGITLGIVGRIYAMADNEEAQIAGSKNEEANNSTPAKMSGEKPSSRLSLFQVSQLGLIDWTTSRLLLLL